MPIEIREIIIKTEIVSDTKNTSSIIKGEDIALLRKQLQEEFKRAITEKTKRNSYNR